MLKSLKFTLWIELKLSGNLLTIATGLGRLRRKIGKLIFVFKETWWLKTKLAPQKIYCPFLPGKHTQKICCYIKLPGVSRIRNSYNWGWKCKLMRTVGEDNLTWSINLKTASNHWFSNPTVSNLFQRYTPKSSLNHLYKNRQPNMLLQNTRSTQGVSNHSLVK